MQNGVNLETSENDLVVRYGSHMPILSDDDRLLALSSLKYILSDMNYIRTKYIRLGFHLSEFQECKHYIKFGYHNMEDFCAANLGLDKSAVSRCISVYREFNASKFITCENGVKKVGCAMDLDDRYNEYSYSQLCEMVSMTDHERSQITPDMTIKQIREIKKGFNKSSDLSESINELDKMMDDSLDVSPVATSQQEKFSLDKYCGYQGIVRQNYVKRLNGEKFILELFDSDGKHLFHGRISLLSKDTNFLRIRIDEILDDE